MLLALIIELINSEIYGIIVIIKKYLTSRYRIFL